MFNISASEKKYLSAIFTLLIIVTFYNLQISFRKSRDAQRRSDINSLFGAISRYQNEFGFFPPSADDGRIVACHDNEYVPPPKDLPEAEYQKYYIASLESCDWGQDPLQDISDLSYPPYLQKLPQDPYHDRGYSYFYISNGRRFQLFAHLEGGSKEDGFNKLIVGRDLRCGNVTCNYAKTFSDEDPSKTLEDIEKELVKKASGLK